uniref:anthranilate synthase component 2 n=1 Tax=Rhodaphanes brevistipitata TaxID=446136 RepID=UPI001FCDEAF4|nr:anthranilate synthase component 2 [Rhodaphanes brevistipitata]UNJ18482.1 anthranilate synthase component 2 [Rhodaphanes brevistipitata]
MILIIDNYDSFTYNLVQYVGELGFLLKVIRNDQLSKSILNTLKPNKIIISPGPGKPENSGGSLDIIRKFCPKIPILGVCLGHQGIGYIFGAEVIKTSSLMHGKTSYIFHNSNPIFEGISNPFVATRYHSLIINNKNLPTDLIDIIAWTEDNVIMGISIKKYPQVIGIQFHPESLWTIEGKKILSNFLSLG